MNNRTVDNYNQKEKRLNFSQKKENTINSLLEVEHFLCNLKRAFKYINFYKFLN